LERGFASLMVWQDKDANGVTDVGELRSLADVGITSINVAATDTDTTIAGNRIAAQGSFTKSEGSTGHDLRRAVRRQSVRQQVTRQHQRRSGGRRPHAEPQGPRNARQSPCRALARNEQRCCATSPIVVAHVIDRETDRYPSRRVNASQPTRDVVARICREFVLKSPFFPP
jgi:hypothetical protein